MFIKIKLKINKASVSGYNRPDFPRHRSQLSKAT